jgi:hypothetical protein
VKRSFEFGYSQDWKNGFPKDHRLRTDGFIIRAQAVIRADGFSSAQGFRSPYALRAPTMFSARMKSISVQKTWLR